MAHLRTFKHVVFWGDSLESGDIFRLNAWLVKTARLRAENRPILIRSTDDECRPLVRESLVSLSG